MTTEPTLTGSAGTACYADGCWPLDCNQRAFVDGAKWWQWQSQGSTMFPSEVDDAESEAVKRYGVIGVEGDTHTATVGQGVRDRSPVRSQDQGK